MLVARSDPARLRVDEVVPGLDRPAGPAHRRPARRDRRARPLVLVFAALYGATGAAAALIGSSAVFAVFWTVQLGRLRARACGSGRVNVLIVSGIWPPDVGGPATHAPELASWLAAHGHRVEALTTADAQPAAPGYAVHWVSRRLPPGARHAAVAAAVAKAARRADVVYATSMIGRTAAGAALARRPFVAKLTSDPAFERSRRRGLVDGETVRFQEGGGGVRAAALRAIRDRSVRRAAVSSARAPTSPTSPPGGAERPTGVVVLPNPAPAPSDAAAVDVPGERAARRLRRASDRGQEPGRRDRCDARARHRDARRRRRRGGARPARARRRRAGAVPWCAAPRGRARVLADADVAVLPSAWENFPHAAVEALAIGTPVVATRVGGVPEIVVDGENGLLVEPERRGRVRRGARARAQDDDLRARLAAAAAPSVARFAIDTVYGEIERLLAEAAR